jgi:hypothetical protein
MLPEPAPEELPDPLAPLAVPDMPLPVPDVLPLVVPDPLPLEAPEVPDDALGLLLPQPTMGTHANAASTRSSARIV